MALKKCIEKTEPLIYDEACLDIYSNATKTVQINGQYAECWQCDYVPYTTIDPSENSSILIDTKYEFRISFIEDKVRRCDTWYHFDEHGIYGWNISDHDCSSVYIKEAPDNPYLPILGAFIVFLLFGTIWYGIKCIYRSGCTSGLRHRIAKFSELENDLGTPQPSPSTTTQPPSKIHKRPGFGRVKSLDVFRGLAIVLMIFVNYGGGQYSVFKHSIWNGLTVADLVFPWFAWIMGVSTALSVRSALRAGVSRRKLAWHAFIRCVSLIIIGITLNTVSKTASEADKPHDSRLTDYVLTLDTWGTEVASVRSPTSIENLRIPGVLQRLGVAGFIVALMEIMFMQVHSTIQNSRFDIVGDLVECWRQWIVVIALVITHTCITFLLDVPGCPQGYLWPGGLHHNGDYKNCTGGAAGYIDRILFGPNHLYQKPTFKKMYQTDVPYDPEGLLGTLTTVLCVYLGVQAGRIMLTYNNHKSRVWRWLIWAIFTGVISGWLCDFSKNNGVIPVNKNLWSVSYVLSTCSMAFIIMSIIYLMVDVTRRWGGRPLFYPGMNSIFLYIGHTLTKNMFPWSWEPKYYTHREFMAINLWATFLWVAISIFLYKKRIILKL